MADITDEVYASRLTIFQDLFANKISSPKAAEQVASASLAADALLEEQLGLLWSLILKLACKYPEHQDKLVDVVVDLSELPDATTAAESETSQPQPLIIYKMQVWKDLPMFGWEVREYWNLSVPVNGTREEKQDVISNMVNISRFIALLIATDEPIFANADYLWFALVTLREALETPWVLMLPGDPLNAWIPAAAAWIEVLGVEIYDWEEEYESGPEFGARGRGGPLWEGKHGFSKGRWKLWRERFGEFSRKEDESAEVRRIAEEAELMMKEIEAGHVE
ncbi:hypothetical protein BDW59DRAFT_178477 [Aspergillus cavernicola]|uniref:Uncharacterized protein n=1 Tax=Aspergillus cavernicola TaxID=176166 RepID=A0ABR4IP51_9EURO